jgi:alpha-maltose-1-phosphate synthase
MPHPRISLVHPIANPNSRQAALALWEANLLHEVITTIAYNQNDVSRYINLLPKNIKNTTASELGRRIWEAPDGFPLRTHPWQEIMRVVLMRTGLSRFNRGSLKPINWVCSSLDLHAAKHHLHGLDAVYAYEDAAATTFQTAQQQGILCLYELPILFYRMSREIQAQEAELFPDLAPALQAIQETAAKIERKEQEIQLADHIFVASSISKKSLLDAGVASDKISAIPYGAPIEYFQPQPKTDKLFRALFVGSVSPRKGVHYLLQAWKELQLSDAELLLVGGNCFPQNWLKRYEDIFRYVPSVPHALLNQYYSSASVFVFPSLVEGFGLVLLEAMACGIPVITTPNTAGPDIITDGIEGFIVPIRDVAALKEKLEWCYSHPQELAQMGQAARRKAEQLTWELYRQKLASRVQELLNHRVVN